MIDNLKLTSGECE